MKISEKLSLNASQLQLDFVNVDMNHDCPLYIDPFLIANSNSQWTIETDQVIKNFFNEFKTAVITANYQKAKELFIFMSEPKENCLGVSKKGTTNGHGVGELNTQKILDKIIQSNALENNLVNNIEDIVIFVEDIDRDKLSDMVTNIIRKKLIEYTQSQCELWGIQLTQGETMPYWDPVDRQWVYSDENLLIIDEREILLIPKAIVSPINIFEASKYRWHFVVEQERNFHLARRSSLVKARTLKNGDVKYYLPKKDVDDDISKQIENGEYRNTKDYLREYTQQYPELFTDFINLSKRKIRSLTNVEIAEKIEAIEIEQIIDNLIKELVSIPTGKNDATKYHHFVKMLLEILWYPYLINPIIEREIHDGRKRIDIVMDNNSREGFFYNMHRISKIFCPYIYIECKNYGKDVANPEIDQLAGRFSTGRGEFGILVCRSLENENLFLNRCRDTYKDGRGLVIYLTDEDIIMMLEAVRDDEIYKIWTLMDTQKRDVMLA